MRNKNKLTDIGRAIDDAAGELPEGYRVFLEIERHGYGLDLRLPNGTHKTIDCAGDLDENIRDAVAIAQTLAAEAV